MGFALNAQTAKNACKLFCTSLFTLVKSFMLFGKILQSFSASNLRIVREVKKRREKKRSEKNNNNKNKKERKKIKEAARHFVSIGKHY